MAVQAGVGFVSYGGVAAGTRSVEQLQQVVTAVKLTPVIEQVNVPFYQQFIEDGERWEQLRIESRICLNGGHLGRPATFGLADGGYLDLERTATLRLAGAAKRPLIACVS
jgi:hypothetical protein